VGFDQARLEQMLNEARQRRPSFGAAIADVSKVGPRLGLLENSGVYVGKINPGSVAEKLGLRTGDIIMNINGRFVTSTEEFAEVLSRLHKGSRIALSFLRENHTNNVEGTL
jgi:S1-C subfamily serine protease